MPYSYGCVTIIMIIRGFVRLLASPFMAERRKGVLIASSPEFAGCFDIVRGEHRIWPKLLFLRGTAPEESFAKYESAFAGTTWS